MTMTSALQNEIFQDETKARAWLEQRIWPRGPVCPHCGATEFHTELKGISHRPGLYQCNQCRNQFTVTVGTVFERSKIPLNKWLMATFLMCSSKKGMSAHQIHRMLDISYKSTWFMCHRIREAMNDGSTGPLGSNGGPVEVDETYWGNVGKQRNGARGYDHKMKVVSLVERDGKKRSFHVANVTAKTVTPILKAQVAKNARLMTDEAKVYTKIGREYAEHGVVNHSAGEYARGDITTNTVESSFAILKRGLYGTFHHVSEAHLQRYATEFDFKWNHRVKLGFDDNDRTIAAVKGISGKRLTYRRTGEAQES
jgi:transposase-like protein